MQKISDAELLARIDADADEPIGPAVDGATLRALADAVRRRGEADAEVTAAVGQARAEGLSWTVIGAALGISRTIARDCDAG